MGITNHCIVENITGAHLTLIVLRLLCIQFCHHNGSTMTVAHTHTTTPAVVNYH